LASRADSENENQEITPDTDTDSQEHLAKHQMMPPPHSSQSAFKRAPVMGTRLDARNNKSRSSQRKTPLGNAPLNQQQSSLHQQATVVGALEVQNVKRAINRYGTLPKSSRIGAYLESLRQNGENESPQPQTAQQQQLNTAQANILGIPTVEQLPSTHSPRTPLKVQPQMIRSNSSGGVTMTNSATASLTKLQRHRTTTDGTMMTTFSSFRSTGSNNSPKRNIPVTLAELEFPPPPPPGETPTTHSPRSCQSKYLTPAILEEFDGNSNQFHPDIPSMRNQMNNNDVSNTAPSVEEASTRFGVSLRKREPSTDSCSSLGSPANDLNEPLQKSPFLSNSSNNGCDVVPKGIDPAAMLVSELAETMHIPKPDASLKPSELARKPATPKPILPAATSADSNGIQFKAQLKKVEPKKVTKEQPKDEISTSIIDFKSRLRKVDHAEADNNASDDTNKLNNKSDSKLSDELTCNTHNNNNNNSNSNKMKPNNNNNNSINNNVSSKKTEIKIDVVDDKKKESNGDGKPPSSDEDDKRKSTGSISSLKKLWETKPSANTEHANQLSPKMGSAMKKKDDCDDNHNINTSPIGMHQHESSMEPPVAKKPAVPVKPSKFTIYATPIQQQGANNNHHNNASNSASPSSRENILELVQTVECNLKIPVNMITATQWLQLSEKLNIIQSSCVTYADTETMPPHTKFQFRELVTRVENQSNCLRTAGQKNVQDNEKLLIEVGQSLKQLSNALHR
jgi:abelson tyrosine-protein kinase 1